MIALSANAISPTLPVCEICTQVADAVFDFLAKYQLALHGDQAAQTDLAARHGFCGPHTAHFEAIAAPREICTGFAGVAEQQAARLRRPGAAAAQCASGLSGGDRGAADGCHLPCLRDRPRHHCPGCQADGGASAEEPNALRELSAICLPHLTFAAGGNRRPGLVAAVLLRQADLLDRLAEDMRHFALKRDGMQRHLTTKEEVAAGERALRVLVGNPRAQSTPTSPVTIAGTTAPARLSGS